MMGIFLMEEMCTLACNTGKLERGQCDLNFLLTVNGFLLQYHVTSGGGSPEMVHSNMASSPLPTLTSPNLLLKVGLMAGALLPSRSSST